jgi:hypothetical protein
MKITLKPLKRKDIQLNEIDLVVGKQEADSLFYPTITSLIIDSKYEDRLQVYLKAKQNANVLSIVCGTVGNTQVPQSLFLKDFLDQNLAFTFFIQLIDPETSNVVASMKKPQRASVHKINSLDNSPIAIVTMPTAPRLWDLKIIEGEKPALHISEDVLISDNLKSNSIFLSSVLPIAVEQIIDHMITNVDQIDEEPWFEDWEKLFSKLKVTFPDANADDEDFQTFKANFLDKWLKQMSQRLYAPAIQELNSQDTYGDDFNAT